MSKCTVPMFSMGSPSGFCGEVTYGSQLPAAYLKETRYMQNVPYCTGAACVNHGGPDANEVLIYADGVGDDGRRMWCAVMPDFINLQESPAGFDGNPMIAVEKLKKQLRQLLNNNIRRTVSD